MDHPSRLTGAAVQPSRLLALLMVVLVTGCATSASITGDYQVATHPVSDMSRQARAEGTLQGQINGDGTACFWLGAGKDRAVIVWPDGYFARSSPISVFDENRNRVGEVGSSIVLSGGVLASTAKVTGCSDFSQVWFVGEVLAGE